MEKLTTKQKWRGGALLALLLLSLVVWFKPEILVLGLVLCFYGGLLATVLLLIVLASTPFNMWGIAVKEGHAKIIVDWSGRVVDIFITFAGHTILRTAEQISVYSRFIAASGVEPKIPAARRPRVNRYDVVRIPTADDAKNDDQVALLPEIQRLLKEDRGIPWLFNLRLNAWPFRMVFKYDFGPYMQGEQIISEEGESKHKINIIDKQRLDNVLLKDYNYLLQVIGAESGKDKASEAPAAIVATHDPASTDPKNPQVSPVNEYDIPEPKQENIPLNVGINIWGRITNPYDITQHTSNWIDMLMRSFPPFGRQFVGNHSFHELNEMKDTPGKVDELTEFMRGVILDDFEENYGWQTHKSSILFVEGSGQQAKTAIAASMLEYIETREARKKVITSRGEAASLQTVATLLAGGKKSSPEEIGRKAESLRRLEAFEAVAAAGNLVMVPSTDPLAVTNALLVSNQRAERPQQPQRPQGQRRDRWRGGNRPPQPPPQNPGT